LGGLVDDNMPSSNVIRMNFLNDIGDMMSGGKLVPNPDLHLMERLSEVPFVAI
jgi:hypothetical protein